MKKTLVLHVSKYRNQKGRLCNHNCLFCIEKIDLDCQEEILPSLSEINSALDLFSQKNGDSFKVFIAGGEPILRPDFFEIIHLVKRYTDDFVLSTNCDYEDADRMCCLFHRSGIKSVSTSVHASNAQLHDSITLKKGSFENTIAVLKKLVKFNINADVNCVVCSKNVNDIPNVASFFKNHGIALKKLTFTHYAHHGNAFYHDDLLFDANEYSGKISEILDRLEDFPYKIKFRDFPFCIDKRLFFSNESVEEFEIAKISNSPDYGEFFIKEKAPFFEKVQCKTCEFSESGCPKFLIANCGEVHFYGQSN